MEKVKQSLVWLASKAYVLGLYCHTNAYLIICTVGIEDGIAFFIIKILGRVELINLGLSAITP
ncbi:MAG: hypothetical protein ACI8SJ_001577 [Shewanella sp.]|jgi:hypothetical protein